MIEHKCKILFTIPTLQAGGAERVLVNLLNYWASREDLELVLLVHEGKNSKPFYPIDPKIRILYTGHWRGWKKLFLFFSTYHYIRKIKPDIVIGFILWNYIITAIASRIARIPCIVAERSSLHVVQNFFVKWIRGFACQVADCIVVQTERAKTMILKSFREKTSVIYNPLVISIQKINYKATHIVAAGRLSKEKEFDILIKAFAVLVKDYPQWTLTIWGEGPTRASLEKLIFSKRLETSVFLPAFTGQLFNELSKASIFALSSRFEGMPNALAEAMGLGLAVVSTDCLTGPRELIDDKKDGFLVPVGDIEELAKALKRLMDDESLRKDFGQRAAKKMKRYNIKTIAALWEKEWESILGKK